jgi:hypothetical protein
VDVSLKLDEESKNTQPEEVAEERKGKTEASLRLEEEPEDRDEEGIEEMKIGQGLRGRVSAYGSVHPSPPSQHSPRARHTSDGTDNIPSGRAYGSRG